MKAERTALGQMKLVDLTGKTFGRYAVIERRGSNVRGEPLWLCRCECGAECMVLGRNLRRGHSTGCRRCSGVKHGHGRPGRQTPEYAAWAQAKNRCRSPSDPQWKHYGGRGIQMCARWADSFEAFLEDMGLRPSSAHSLDRYPDNDGHYEPGNCRWATATQQQANRRNNVLVEFRGRTQCVAAWAREFAIPEHVLRGRVRRGWAMERAVSQAIEPRRPRTYEVPA